MLLPIENYISLTTFRLSKRNNTEYNYIYAENYIYKKRNKSVEIHKNQTKNHSVLATIFKVYFICTPKCDALETVFSFTKHNGMLHTKHMTNFLFLLSSIAQ